MKKIINILNHLIIMRILFLMYLFLIFTLVQLFLHCFIKEVWLVVLINFDLCLLIVVLYILFEFNYVYRYYKLYHKTFLPMIFKQRGLNYYYKEKDIMVNEVDDNFNIIYYLRTYLQQNNKMNTIIYNRYVIMLLYIINNDNNNLIIMNKRIAIKNISNLLSKTKRYKIYSESNNTSSNVLHKIKLFIKKYYQYKFLLIIIERDIGIIYLKSNYFKQPFLKIINQKFINKIDKEIKEIKKLMNDFVLCLN